MGARAHSRPCPPPRGSSRGHAGAGAWFSLCGLTWGCIASPCGSWKPGSGRRVPVLGFWGFEAESLGQQRSSLGQLGTRPCAAASGAAPLALRGVSLPPAPWASARSTALTCRLRGQPPPQWPPPPCASGVSLGCLPHPWRGHSSLSSLGGCEGECEGFRGRPGPRGMLTGVSCTLSPCTSSNPTAS